VEATTAGTEEEEITSTTVRVWVAKAKTVTRTVIPTANLSNPTGMDTEMDMEMATRIRIHNLPQLGSPRLRVCRDSARAPLRPHRAWPTVGTTKTKGTVTIATRPRRRPNMVPNREDTKEGTKEGEGTRVSSPVRPHSSMAKVVNTTITIVIEEVAGVVAATTEAIREAAAAVVVEAVTDDIWWRGGVLFWGSYDSSCTGEFIAPVLLFINVDNSTTMWEKDGHGCYCRFARD